VTVKSFNISLDIVPANIYLTLSPEGYIKVLKKFLITADIRTPGRTSILSKNGVITDLIVFINCDILRYNIYDLKGLLVHELSHVVTEVFNEYQFSCDEARSYMLQRLYITAAKIVDKEIENADKG
jgi:hypothetical protein